MKALSKLELREALVTREPADHKGIFGHVLVVAGSRNMAGAAVLATRAALRSGAAVLPPVPRPSRCSRILAVFP